MPVTQAVSVTLRVNGETHSLPDLDPRTTRLDALRVAAPREGKAFKLDLMRRAVFRALQTVGGGA